MEEQNERERAKVRAASEEPDVEAHRAKSRPRAEEADDAKSDETPDVEAHMKVRRT